MSMEQSMRMQEQSVQMQTVHGGMSQNGHEHGHLYMQTNETRNDVVHYRRSGDGTISEVDRVSTGGAVGRFQKAV
jgi:hypothetical protein